MESAKEGSASPSHPKADVRQNLRRCQSEK
jgi:hypothetical protein